MQPESTYTSLGPITELKDQSNDYYYTINSGIFIMSRFSYFLAAFAVLFFGLASSHASSDLMKKLVKDYKVNTLKVLPKNGTCTADNIVVRKEW